MLVFKKWTNAMLCLVLLSAVLLLVVLPRLNIHKFAQYLLPHSSQKAGESFTQYVPQQLLFNDTVKNSNVLIVGSSDIREFFPHNTSLEKLLNQSCHSSVVPFHAGTSSQSLSDTFAILETALSTGMAPELVIIGLSEGRLLLDNSSVEQSLSRMRVVLPTPISLTSEDSYINQFKYFINETTNFIRLWSYDNNLENLTTGTKIHVPLLNRNYYVAPPLPPEYKLQRLYSDFEVYAPMFRRNASITATMYSKYLEKLGLEKEKVLFVYTPRSELAWPTLRENEVHRQQALNIIRSNGFKVVDLQYESALSDHHFYDGSHLLAQGRDTFWNSANGKSLLAHICQSL